MTDFESLVLEGVKTAFAERVRGRKFSEPDLAWLFFEDPDAEDAEAEQVLVSNELEGSEEPAPRRRSKKLVPPKPKEDPVLRLPHLFSSLPGTPTQKANAKNSPLAMVCPHHSASTRTQDLESFLFDEAATSFLQLESQCGIPLMRSPNRAPGTPLLCLEKVEKMMRRPNKKEKGNVTRQQSHGSDANGGMLESAKASARAQKSRQLLQSADNVSGEGTEHVSTHSKTGPPSRHVRTRAKQVAVQARQKADMRQSNPPAEKNYRVCDADGNVHFLPGVHVTNSGASPLKKMDPFPIFCKQTVVEPPPEMKPRKPMLDDHGRFAIKPSDLLWDYDREVDEEVLDIMDRSSSNLQAPAHASGFLAHEAPTRKCFSVDDLTRPQNREPVFRASHLVSANLRWAKGSPTRTRLEELRNSEEKRKQLRLHVTKEIPQRRRESQQYAVDFLKLNMEEAKEGEFVRAPSGSTTLIRKQRRRSSIDCTTTSSNSGSIKDRPQASLQPVGQPDPPAAAMGSGGEDPEACEQVSMQSVLCALQVAMFARALHARFSEQKRQIRQEKANSFRAIVNVQRWYRKVKDVSLVRVITEVEGNRKAAGRDSPLLTQGLVMKCQMNVRVMHKRGTVAIIIAFLRDVRVQSNVKTAVKKYHTAVVRVQRCIRTFLAVRRVRWMVWKTQWVTYEKRKNRELMRIWRKQWQQTTNEISRVLKLKPGSDKLKNKKVHPATVRWVGNVMDNFIANLPPEVKNIMDVPPDIREEILLVHKASVQQAHAQRMEAHRRRLEQVTANRRFRDILFVTFPKLSEMDLKDPELQFLVDCSVDPIPPFQSPVLQVKTLEAMIEQGKNMARGLEPRRVLVGRGVTTTTDRRSLPTMPEVEHEDALKSAGIQKYLVTKNETNKMMSELVDLSRETSPKYDRVRSPSPQRAV